MSQKPSQSITLSISSAVKILLLYLRGPAVGMQWAKSLELQQLDRMWDMEEPTWAAPQAQRRTLHILLRWARSWPCPRVSSLFSDRDPEQRRYRLLPSQWSHSHPGEVGTGLAAIKHTYQTRYRVAYLSQVVSLWECKLFFTCSKSALLRAVAWTLISTCPSFGWGVGIVRSSRFSGPPGASTHTACIIFAKLEQHLCLTWKRKWTKKKKCWHYRRQQQCNLWSFSETFTFAVIDTYCPAGISQ